MNKRLRHSLARSACLVGTLFCGMAGAWADEGAGQESAVRVAWSRRPLEIEAFQRAWVMERIPSGTPEFGQSRYILNTRIYQAVPVVLPGGEKRIVYFDITGGRSQ